ncbi:orotidine 5'-phosphate decarboxylase [Acidithiobacillus marinus]|uniref:Orotidine 5'-phosphate decarboxylase n=1 Tax=Acidithiobacillus marinus TaxID=187490 RepID=A0A2I1DN94_9PROT|nr:orotidine-5'-phosphate decarboxylase [Acidithiobacillus marinus]PKY11341.1 orotidine 5'-phosphate decarboxylase [Acidithiobacillus marinus]
MKSPLIVALDYADPSAALDLAALLDPSQCRVKIGKELFTVAGPLLVEQLQDKGFEVFLDLKFHDIPQTVAKACHAAAQLGVWMLNVHASGGQAMLEAARKAVDASPHRPLLIAVTVLTSLDAPALQQVGVFDPVSVQVERLAALSAAAGLDGLVCSAQEAAQMKLAHPELCLVTPGIRPPEHIADDQKRTMTPAAALAAGADYLVVGRPITAAADPAQALAAMLAACAA